MQTDQLVEHLSGSVLGALDVLTVHIGDQLGLYALLHDRGALTAPELAGEAPMDPRYAREWLEQQTVAGFVDVDDAALPPEARRYSISDEHAAVLVDRDSLAYFTPFARLVAAAALQVPALLEVYRSGGGLGWSTYGELMRTAQADGNRPLFLGPLGSDWLPSLPAVDRALREGGRVADIGCGEGWSSIGIALAYPQARVDGYDLDEASLEAAARHASEHDVSERVRFHLADVGAAEGSTAEGGYDLVTALECVHDMPDPVSVLAGARRMVREGGTVLVMDERVPDVFTGPGDPVEQLLYGFSLLVCLPDGLSHDGSVGTGTVMRAPVLRDYAQRAGFRTVEVLDIEHDTFRFYRLAG